MGSVRQLEPYINHKAPVSDQPTARRTGVEDRMQARAAAVGRAQQSSREARSRRPESVVRGVKSAQGLTGEGGAVDALV